MTLTVTRDGSPNTQSSPRRGKSTEVTGKITDTVRDALALQNPRSAASIGRSSPLQASVVLTPKITDNGKGLLQNPPHPILVSLESPSIRQTSASALGLSTPARLTQEQQEELVTARQCIQAGKQEIVETRYDSALSKFGQGIAIFSKLAPSGKDLADAFSFVGSAHEQKNELNEALTNYQKAVEIYSHLSLDPMNSVRIYKKIALVCEAQGKSAEAFTNNEAIARIYENHLQISNPHPPTSLELATVYNKMALLLEDRHAFADALKYLRKCSEIKVIHEKGSLSLANCYDRMGAILKGMGNQEEARTFFKKSLAIEEELHTQVKADSFRRILTMYVARDNARELNAVYVNANKGGQSFDLFSVATSYLCMAKVKDASDLLRLGVEKYEDSLSEKEALSPQSQFVAAALENVGDAYIASKRLDKANPFYVRALQILSRTRPEADLALTALKQKAKGLISANVESSVARAGVSKNQARGGVSMSQAREGSTVRGPSVMPSDEIERLIVGLGGYSSGRVFKTQIKDEAAEKLKRLVLQFRDAAQDKKDIQYQEVSKYVNDEVDRQNNPIFDGAHSSNLFALFRDCSRVFPR